jgi:hypothetical protein
LEAASALIASTNEDIGTTVKERENGEILMKLQNEIVGLDVNLRGQPNRLFLKGGMITKLCRRQVTCSSSVMYKSTYPS